MSITLNKDKTILTVEVPFDKKGTTSNGPAKSTLHVKFNGVVDVEGFGPLRINFNGTDPKSGIPLADRKPKAA